MEKPKNLHHQNRSFQEAVNIGKNVRRITSDSKAGKQMMNTKGSIFADGVSATKQWVLAQVAKLPKPGCGAKEIARRAKQIGNIQHDGTFRQYNLQSKGEST